MKIRQLNKVYVGLIFGYLGAIIGFLLAYLYVFQYKMNIPLGRVFNMMKFSNNLTAKMISLGLIFNLVFLYGLLKYDLYRTTRGVVLATLTLGLAVLYFKFFA